jgi:hypothetical protein
VIAESPDATQEMLVCAWCERPLRGANPPAGTARRCDACGSRMGAWPMPTLILPARGPLDPADRADGAAPEPAAPSRCGLADALRHRAHRRIVRRVERMAPPGPVLDVHAGLDITALGGRYAAIVFWQSLGRTADPRTALEHAAALLKPTGLLTIAQPAAGLPALTERLRGGPAAPAQRVRIPQQALVERLRALGLEVLHADRAGGIGGVGGWPTTLLGGVAAVEARRQPR